MNKLIKLSFFSAIFVIAMFANNSCKKEVGGKVYTVVWEQKPKNPIDVGEKTTGILKITPADYKEDDFTVTSSPTTVATAKRSVQGNKLSVEVTGVSPGTATITVALKADPDQAASMDITVKPIAGTLTVAVAKEYTFTGAAIEPKGADVTVKHGDATLAATQYTLEYSNNINVGEATITAKGTGNYAGSTGSGKFKINPAAAGTLAVTVTGTYPYTGSPIVPAPANVTVKAGDKTLTVETDYTLAYTDNTNAGKATATATGKGNYAGSTGSVQFDIQPKVVTLEVAVSKSYPYTGSAITPAAADVTVKADGSALPAADYTLAPTGNINAGDATLAVTAVAGNYKGSAGSGKFTITPKVITTLEVSVSKSYPYTGSAITPAAADVTVKADGNTLAAADYTFTPGSNVNAGDATLSVTVGSGNYKGSTGSGKFTITPKIVTLEVTVSKTYTYNGAAITPATADMTVKAEGATLPAADYTFTPANNINAGEATLAVTAVAGNYKGSTGNCPFTIAKFAVTVTANNMTKFTGDTDPVFTYTWSPPLFGYDIFSGKLTREAGEVVGTPYAITQGDLGAGNNYAITFQSGVFTIIPHFAGSGTSSDPYIIDMPERLAKLAEYVNAGTAPYADAGKYYKLNADINLSVYGVTFNGGKGWIPIGTSSSRTFSGHFDGNGHTVSGLYINGSSGEVGLFGRLLNATIKNLGVAGTVTGSGSVGGLAGWSRSSTITNCYSSVTVTGTGTSSTGGLVGADNGTIINCYTTGNVRSTGMAGGISAGNTATNCYATGAISSTSNYQVGGISIGNTSNSVALNPSVTTGTSTIGRVTGAGTPTNNLAWEGMTVKGEIITDGALNNRNGLNVSADDAKKQTTYVGLGWQFGNSDAAPWRMVAGSEYPLPILYWQSAPPAANIDHLK